MDAEVVVGLALLPLAASVALAKSSGSRPARYWLAVLAVAGIFVALTLAGVLAASGISGLRDGVAVAGVFVVVPLILSAAVCRVLPAAWPRLAVAGVVALAYVAAGAAGIVVAVSYALLRL